MSDRYSQVVNAPVVSTIAKQLGLPQPVELDRYKPGAPVVAGAGAQRRRPRRPPRQAICRRFLDQIKAERAGDRGPGQGARLRRHRHRRLDRAGRAAALLLPDRRPPAAQRPRRRARHAAGAAGSPRAAHRPAGAGGLHPLARQGDRRRGSTAQLVYVAEGAEDELDSTLRFLLSPRSAYVSGQVVAVGNGVAADARDRLGAPARRARWRWSPAPRAASARRSPPPCTATAPSSSCSTCRRSPPTCARSPSGSAARRSSSTSPTADAPERIAAAIRRRRRRRRPQRRRHPRPHDRQDAGGALELADGDQPLQRGADQRRAARARAAATPTAASSASPR